MSVFNLGSIKATMGLDASPYASGMVQLQSLNAAFGESVVQFVNNPLLNTVSIMRRLGAATLSHITRTAELGQETHRLSERLGVNAKTISALSTAYRDFNAQQADLSRHLVNLARLMADANEGNLEAQRTLRKLGVEWRDGEGQLRSLDAALRDVSDGLAGLGSEHERINAAQKIFGRGAEDLLQVIGAGSDAIEDLTAKYERMGLVTDQVAAFAADRFAGSLGDVKLALDGLRHRLAQEFLTPFALEMQGVEKDVIESIARIGEAMEGAAAKSGTILGTWLSDSLAGVKEIVESMEDIKASMDEIGAAAGRAPDHLIDHPYGHSTGPVGDMRFGIGGDQFYRFMLRGNLAEYGVSFDGVRSAGSPHDRDAIEAEARARRLERERRMRAMR